MSWKDIASAPQDGSTVHARRIYKGRLIWEGETVWSSMASDAPMRFPSEGGLDGMLPGDNAFADIPTWCTVDRRFHVPAPTEWRMP